MQLVRKFGQQVLLWFANFIAQYHWFIVTLVTSSFLAPYVGEAHVGYVFVGMSAIAALVLYAAPPLFSSFGTRNVLTVLTIAEIAILLGLGIATTVTPIIILITLQGVVSYALFIGIDLLIEATTTHEGITGNVRGAFLTATNIACFLGSLSLAFIIAGDDYTRVFIVGALVMIPFLIMSLWLMPAISHSGTRAVTEMTVVERFRTDKSLARITLANLLLQIFFSLMSIYAPLLLHVYEGFSWGEVGLIFAFAMVPYIVLEYPLGFIADTWLGEKEILVTGFGVVALSLVGMTLLHGFSLWYWVAIMILSRIGAAMVESMTEIHFFKHVDQSDTSTITTFRVLRPFGSVIGPVVVSVLLLGVGLPYVFGLFSLVMLLGVPLALSIVDSK